MCKHQVLALYIKVFLILTAGVEVKCQGALIPLLKEEFQFKNTEDCKDIFLLILGDILSFPAKCFFSCIWYRDQSLMRCNEIS